MHQVARIDQERGEYLKALTEQAQERERIMFMYRRGKLTFDDAEKQLDEIAGEETALRRDCNAIDAQRALVDAYEAHLTEASLMLRQLQEQLEDIDRTDDRTAKQRVIELLVQNIRVDTQA